MPKIIRISSKNASFNHQKKIYIISNAKESFGKSLMAKTKSLLVKHLKCKFGNIGITKAFYFNETAIYCFTPKNISKSIKDDGETTITLDISINGIKFFSTGKTIVFSKAFNIFVSFIAILLVFCFGLI